MSYEPPENDALNFSEEGSYSPPENDSINFLAGSEIKKYTLSVLGASISNGGFDILSGGKDIEVTSIKPSGDLKVSVDSTNSPVAEKDVLDVTATITNETSSQESGTVVFSTGGIGRGVESVQLDSGESTTTTFSWQTEVGDAGQYNAVVDTGTGRDFQQVTIEGLVQGDFSVDITFTNSPVQVGETVLVTADLTNNLSSSQTVTPGLSIDGENVAYREGIPFDAGETRSMTLPWNTSEGDSGGHNAIFSTGTDSDSTTVQVEKEKEDEKTPSGDVSLYIDSTNSPVTEGESLQVEGTATNSTSSPINATIGLDIDGSQITYTDVLVPANGSTSLLLIWNTEDGDAGDYTATLNSGTDSVSTSVTVEERDKEEEEEEDEGGGGIEPDIFVDIVDAPSISPYPSDVSVTGLVHYTGPVSHLATLRLYEDAPGSIGPTADFTEDSYSSGQTRELTLTWDRVDLVDKDLIPLDVEMCMEIDRDGMPEKYADRDCTTVTVGKGTCPVSTTATISGEGTEAWDDSVSLGKFEDCDEIAATVEFDQSGYKLTSQAGVRLVLAGTTIYENTNSTEGRSFTETISASTGGASGELVFEVDDGSATISPP
jgi:hypothetical protein